MTDLIDRAELLKEFYKVAREHHESHIPMVEHDFRELIHNAERVVVRDMAAHWCDRHGEPSDEWHSVYCSACGKWSATATYYCGHCGAKMEGF